MKNQVFTVKDGEYKIVINDEVLPTAWNSHGAALAGLSVELKRRGIHEMSRECWCKPRVLPPNAQVNRPQKAANGGEDEH